MRRNLPVTNVEYVLGEHETIVSKTDLKGKITYVNQDFLRISGFSEDELMRGPHNIVRHPDMPPAAFEDLWNTLKRGKAWTGLVKNRCKNGDYYWVEANAAPLFENGKLIGYTSIRNKAAPEQIAAAQAIYEQINAGSKDLIIREGAVLRRGWRSRLAPLLQLKVRTTILLSHGLLAALFIAALPAAGGGRLMPAIATLGMATCIASALLLSRKVLAPLYRLRADIDQMSTGDLAGRIGVLGDDEMGRLGESLRVLQINVKALIGQMREATQVVADGTAELAAGNADLSARTEAQVAAIEETAASMNELTSTVKGNADNAHETETVIRSAAAAANAGGSAVSEAVRHMELIKESSRKIVEIIGVVDSIAFQTNILALNASVEAARAGEKGRGFAVVATEVRQLAQRCASAAKEIKLLIGNAVEHIDDGAKVVGHAGNVIGEIVGQVGRVAANMGDISNASREQHAGIAQASQAIIHMDGATQQNAALVEQVAASASRMRHLAVGLAQLAACFTLHRAAAAPGRFRHLPHRSALPGARCG